MSFPIVLCLVRLLLLHPGKWPSIYVVSDPQVAPQFLQALFKQFSLNNQAYMFADTYTHDEKPPMLEHSGLLLLLMTDSNSSLPLESIRQNGIWSLLLFSQFIVVEAPTRTKLSDGFTPTLTANKLLEPLNRVNVPLALAVVLDSEEVCHYYQSRFQKTSSQRCTDAAVSLKPINIEAKLAFDQKNRKLIKKWMGCQSAIGVHYWPPYVFTYDNVTIQGFEISLINTISKFLNITVKIEESLIFGSRLPQLFERMLNCQLDLITGGFFAQSKLRTSMTSTYWQSAIYWYVPASKEASFLNSFRGFRLDYISFSTCIMCMITFLIVKLSKYSKFKTDRKIFSDAWKIWLMLHDLFMYQPIKRTPRASVLRGLFILWIILSFYWGLFAQIGMISIFTNPLYDYQISDESELSSSGLRVTVMDTYKLFFANEHIDEKCLSLGQCVRRFTTERNSALAMASDYMDYKFFWKFQGSKRSLIFKFKNPILRGSIVSYLSPGNPTLLDWSWTTERLVEGGFIDYWISVIRHSQWRFGGRSGYGLTTPQSSYILKNLEVIITTIGIGWTISLAGFLIELLTHFLLKWKPKTPPPPLGLN